MIFRKIIENTIKGDMDCLRNAGYQSKVAGMNRALIILNDLFDEPELIDEILKQKRKELEHEDGYVKGNPVQELYTETELSKLRNSLTWLFYNGKDFV